MTELSKLQKAYEDGQEFGRKLRDELGREKAWKKFLEPQTLEKIYEDYDFNDDSFFVFYAEFVNQINR